MPGIEWRSPVETSADLLRVSHADGVARLVEDIGFAFVFYASEQAWIPFVGADYPSIKAPEPVYLPLHALARAAMTEEELEEDRQRKPEKPEGYIDEAG
jgi:hypothetical protein